MQDRVEVEAVGDDGRLARGDFEHAVRADDEVVSAHLDLEFAGSNGADAKFANVALELDRAAGLDGEDVEGDVAGDRNLLGRGDE